MDRRERVVLGAIVALLLATGGCLGPSSPASGDEPLYETASATPEPLADSTACPDVTVSFWGLDDPAFWSPDTVRVSTTLPANSSFLFVAAVDGTVRGVRALDDPATEDGTNADGLPIGLDEALAGEHAVRVVVYRDGELDRGTDRPCRDEGGVVQTRYLVVDFSRLSAGSDGDR